MPRWTREFEDRLRRTILRGQLTIEGDEAAESVEMPENAPEKPQKRISGASASPGQGNLFD